MKGIHEYSYENSKIFYILFSFFYSGIVRILPSSKSSKIHSYGKKLFLNSFTELIQNFVPHYSPLLTLREVPGKYLL
jgi:hypothetical protein